MADPKLKVHIEAIDKTSKAFKSIGKKFNKLGKDLTMKASLPLAAFGGLSIKTAAAFDASMNQVQATLGQFGEQGKKNIEPLRVLAKDLGSQTAFSASEAAQAQNFLAMAGLNQKQILESLPGALDLAAAGNMDLAEAADIATNVMKGMGFEANQLTQINDVMAFTATKSNTSVAELGEALKSAAPIARAAGVSLEETSAILGNMADAGFKGSEAGNAFKTGILRLAKPTKEAQTAFKKLGINLQEFVDPKGQVKLSELMFRLRDANAGLAEMGDIFGKQQAAKFIALMGDDGPEAVKKLNDSILELSDGTAKKMAGTLMQGAPGAIKKMQSAFESMMIAIAESGLIDAFTEIANGLAGIFSWVNKLNPAILKWASVIAVVVATIGPMLWIFGSISSGIGVIIGAVSALLPVLALLKAFFIGLAGALLANPITWIILAIVAVVAGAVYLIYKHWQPIVEFFKSMWDNIAGFFADAYNTIKGWIDKIISYIQPVLDLVDKVVNLSLDDITSGVTDAVSGIGDSIADGVSDAGNAIADGASSAWNYLFGDDENEKKIPALATMQSQFAPTPLNQVMANRDRVIIQKSNPQEIKGGVDVNVNIKGAPFGTTVQSESRGKAIKALDTGVGFAESF